MLDTRRSTKQGFVCEDAKVNTFVSCSKSPPLIEFVDLQAQALSCLLLGSCWVIFKLRLFAIEYFITALHGEA